ncbi:hypothetical protein C8J57DRAFT_1514348 [Mycena rebaudengoi]|nr:hypothetical protein C8J57DRAFT_1514348 [Mycena rebaudengoi]
MASSGLSRRPANAPTTTHDDDETAPSSPPVSATPQKSGGQRLRQWIAHRLRRARSFSLLAGEPRFGGSVPKLTLMEEVLLLGLKDKQGYLSFWSDNISYALRVVYSWTADPRPVTVLSTGETLLDETLKMIKQTEDSGERMGVATWVDLLSVLLAFRRARSHRTASITRRSFPRSAAAAAGISRSYDDTCCSAGSLACAYVRWPALVDWLAVGALPHGCPRPPATARARHAHPLRPFRLVLLLISSSLIVSSLFSSFPRRALCAGGAGRGGWRPYFLPSG